MKEQLKPALMIFFVLTVLTGLIYPLIVTGFAQLLFPYQANGSLILHGGKIVGSELIGQYFDEPQYFWGRPSATSPFPYNASASSGSNLGPTNPALAEAIRTRIAALKTADPGNESPIPVDLVSSIYQQFARSSAEKKARVQGLHYTPVELVHLTLDPVFEDLPATARVIDPTCGSGAFLVEAFRRLIWKRCGDEQASRAVVRDILYHQLFGIDINPSALGIAAFSLYLAALEFDEEPITDITELKFDRLIGTTLFEADTTQRTPST